MQYEKTVLSNGLRIMSVAMPENPTATVLVLVEAGSKYESSKTQGISHFLEHLCFKGTTTRTGKELNIELDGLGARTNAFTSHEMTGYYAKGRVGHVPKLLEIISDLYLNPTLPPEEIEREKGVVIGEIDMYEDMPQAKVSRIFWELMYEGQPAGWPIAGTKEVVRSLDRDTIKDYRDSHYTAENTTVVVCGDIDHASIVTQVKQQFQHMPQGVRNKKVPVIEHQHEPRLVVETKKTDQTHLVMGYRTVALGHQDMVALDILGAVLGSGMSSRLFVRLREEMGVGYYVRAYHSSLTDHGLLTISAGVDSNRINEVLQALLDECNRLKTELVSEKELAKTKQYIIGNFEMNLESSDEVAEFYGAQEILRQAIETPKDVEQKINAITAEDIQRVAQKYLVPEHLNLALIGPHENQDEIRKLLESSAS